MSGVAASLGTRFQSGTVQATKCNEATREPRPAFLINTVRGEKANVRRHFFLEPEIDDLGERRVEGGHV